MKCFAKLTYLEEHDNRTNISSEIDLTPHDDFKERKNHLLEYLVYGYKNNYEDIIPQGNNSIKNDMINITIKNTIKMILRAPSKIKIVLYSQYKMSLMKKYFLNYFNETIKNTKMSDNNINQLNAYNLSDFTTNKIIYYKLDDVENTLNDIRIDELDRISEQIFTFTEDPHESIFYKKLTNDLFFKDEKDDLLKQIWFSKKNFKENITKVQFYFNQLTINNSVILLGLNNKTIHKYNNELLNISYLFNFGNISNTSYFNLTYSIHKISKDIEQNFDNNTLQITNLVENKFISKYDTNSKLNYNHTEDEYFFTINYTEKSNPTDNYLKLFWKNVTCFHIPKVVITIYFVHPFLRPNFQNDKDIPSKNDKLFFYFLLYMSYVKRTIDEKLADAFRAGSNYYYIHFNEDTFFKDFFVFSDIVKQCVVIINDILNNETNFYSALEKNLKYIEIMQ